MELKINQKLFTKDGRVIGNCFVSGIEKNLITVITEDGKSVVFRKILIANMFYSKDENTIKDCLLDIIELADEPAMNLGYLKGLLYKKISEL